MSVPASLINYFCEDLELPSLPENTTLWLEEISSTHGFTIEEINYIFCTDEYLLNINREYLDHDYYTDIITFDNSDEQKLLESDIFISLDRVYENADDLNVPRGTELLRVMSHGLLHLCGFKDKTEQESVTMKIHEEKCLTLWVEKYTK